MKHGMGVLDRILFSCVHCSGLVTLNDMKAKQEALVKEREKQLAKKEQSKELMLSVASPATHYTFQRPVLFIKDVVH